MNSTWINDSTKKKYPKLSSEQECDVLIVGGGISGISLAFNLSKHKDLKVILVEQNLLYHGATGFTTGKVTIQHGYKYQNIIKNYGKEKASQYYKANLEGINIIEKNISKFHIDCDYNKCPHYLVGKDDSLEFLEEKEAYLALNIPFKEVNKDNLRALVIENQATFHIVKYLDGILEHLNKCENVKIYEQTKVLNSYKENGYVKAIGDGFIIKTRKIVYASFYPQYGKFNFAFIHLKPVLSFVFEAKTQKNIDYALICEDNPVFSCRPFEGNMIFAGMSVDASKMPAYLKSFENLKSLADKYFHISKLKEYWLNEDYDPLDYVPLIGEIKKDCYVMTGYNKWGITNSVIGAKIIEDLILYNYSEYKDLYNPKRIKCLINKAWYILTSPVTFIKTFIKNPKTKKCSHLHCALRKNSNDNTYDCACHGSRFDEYGNVIIGPAKKKI